MSNVTKTGMKLNALIVKHQAMLVVAITIPLNAGPADLAMVFDEELRLTALVRS